MSDLHPSLLPNGLKDLLTPEAEDEATIINHCMDVFSSFGYQRIKPPLAEFEESLLAPGPGQSLSHKTFRLMDPVSGRMLGIRADTTAQIARIAGSRLSDEQRPLRLSYASDVLRVKASQLRPDRQFCQVGCELIGAEEIKDDVEIILVALLSLKKAKIENLSIDLTIPSLVDIIYSAEKIKPHEKRTFDALIRKRDRDGLAAIKSNATKTLVSLLDISGAAENAVAPLAKVKLPREGKQNVKRLLAVYAELKQALEAYEIEGLNITFDFIEQRGFEYQNGVSFTLFSNDVRGEIGRGGRYDIVYGNDEQGESAIGFTLYMDSLMQAYHNHDLVEYQVVSHEENWSKIKDMQANGLKVIRDKK